MANIPVYDQPNLGLTPNETGPEAFAAAGRRGGGFYNQAGESIANAGARLAGGLKAVGDAAVDYEDHREINTGAKAYADMFSALTDSWNKTSAGADPHDPAVAKQWREETLEPTLEKFQSGFNTEKSQAWADHTVATLRDHMFEKTEADMSRMAADAVSNTVQTMATKFSNTAFNDPSAVPAMLDAVDHSVDGVLGANPNVKGPDAARVKLEVGEKVRETIAKAGAYGVINNAADPEAALKAYVARPEIAPYVNGAELEQFAKAAKTQARTNTLLTKQIEVAQKQQDALAVEQGHTKEMSENVTVDPQTGRVDIKPQFFKDALDIAKKYPNAPNAASTVQTLLSWGEAQQKKEIATVSDPDTASALTARMFDPNNPTSEIDIRKAQVEHKLSNADAQPMIELVRTLQADPIKDQAFKYAADQAKAQIEGVLPGTKLMAAGKYPAFMQAFVGAYLQAKRLPSGVPSNALDLNDPKSMISQYLQPYKLSLGGTIAGNGGVGAPPPATKPPPTANLPVGTERTFQGTTYKFKGGNQLDQKNWEPAS
jgi:hypothetical protein